MLPGPGDERLAVTALQKDLISCYGYKPATDGVYGELTGSAVVAVQKRVGVKADGDYGSNTRDAMKWANCSLPAGTRISCT
ncbi:peptidoglycan-binding domain-containing protein [Streptomyces cellulosae]